MLYPSELQPRTSVFQFTRVNQDFHEVLSATRSRGPLPSKTCTSTTFWRFFASPDCPPVVILYKQKIGRNGTEGARRVIFRKPEIGWSIPKR
jgi:hypothetical protein